MHLRPARASDVPAFASISARAFHEDELYQYINPRSREYPDSFRNGFLLRNKLRWNQPGYVYFAAVADGEDYDFGTGTEDGRRKQQENSEEEDIVGFALWQRLGDDEAARKWQEQTWWQYIDAALLSINDTYAEFFNIDRSFSAAAVRALPRSEDTFSSMPTRWHLKNLCVLPSWQRKGIGKMLVQWGLRQAEEEKVPATLTTSTVAEGLYRSLGFKTWVRRDFPGIRMSAPALVWWPKGVERVFSGEEDEEV